MTLPMTWQQFAKLLFTSEDADPTYYTLARTKIPIEQKQRFMTAWITFYNPGIAAAASEYEGSRFWQYIILQYKTAKRASERRHFRGAAGLNAIASWRQMFPEPEGMVLHMQGKDYFEVAAKAKTVPQIGIYMTWKFADVQERVFRIPCDFPPEAARHSPKVPQEGAKLIKPDWSIATTYFLISNYMNTQGMKAPPWYDRAMNMQEAETVACVMKQYRKGKWWPHSRTAKATRSLLATPSGTAELMLKALHQKTQIKRNEMNTWQENILNEK